MELKNIPDTMFHSPIELETLILTGNLFQTIPSALERTRKLKKLVLDENPLKNFEKDKWVIRINFFFYSPSRFLNIVHYLIWTFSHHKQNIILIEILFIGKVFLIFITHFLICKIWNNVPHIIHFILGFIKQKNKNLIFVLVFLSPWTNWIIWAFLTYRTLLKSVWEH